MTLLFSLHSGYQRCCNYLVQADLLPYMTHPLILFTYSRTEQMLSVFCSTVALMISMFPAQPQYEVWIGQFYALLYIQTPLLVKFIMKAKYK